MGSTPVSSQDMTSASDFRNKATFGVTLVALCLLFPIAIMNWMEGYVFVAIGTLGIVVLLATNAILVHQGRCHQALTLYCLVPAGMLFMITVFKYDGIIGSLWCFPSIVACYCMLSERRAWLANLCILAIGVPMVITTLAPEHAIRVVATLIAISLFSAILVGVIDKLNRQLQYQVTHDPLTGLFNRMTLRAEIVKTIAMSHRYATPATLLAVDVDHFKMINDEYGHDVGDQALIELARLIRTNLRTTDHAFRTGGEEFLILLNGSNEREAYVIAERLRRAIETATIIPDRAVTISIGAAQYNTGEHEVSESWTQWMRRADKHLYEAKRIGRNRVALGCGPRMIAGTSKQDVNSQDVSRI
ncbi:GGDEF domain-containing protein [bacterium]|nr:GGDEF domain-containing protein [bacterium]